MAKRILVIEDDSDIMEIFDIIFQDEGYEIIASQTGMSADEVSLIHPDLILLDVRLKGFEKTGAEICAELKAYAQTSHLPVLLVSAENGLSDIARKCRADSYVNKPFTINELVNKVKELIA